MLFREHFLIRLMLLFNLLSSPLHSIQFHILRHPRIVSSPSLDQLLEIESIINGKLPNLLFLLRVASQFSQSFQADRFNLYWLDIGIIL